MFLLVQTPPECRSTGQICCSVRPINLQHEQQASVWSLMLVLGSSGPVFRCVCREHEQCTQEIFLTEMHKDWRSITSQPDAPPWCARIATHGGACPMLVSHPQCCLARHTAPPETPGSCAASLVGSDMDCRGGRSRACAPEALVEAAGWPVPALPAAWPRPILRLKASTRLCCSCLRRTCSNDVSQAGPLLPEACSNKLDISNIEFVLLSGCLQQSSDQHTGMFCAPAVPAG